MLQQFNIALVSKPALCVLKEREVVVWENPERYICIAAGDPIEDNL